ncbi:MAG: M23 family metallopeptidase [Longimicrobiales bacterium]|nr:M23 family metallopeptidase [Longimicrobiales bacterium]
MTRFAATFALIFAVAACSARAPESRADRRAGQCAFRVCIQALPGSQSLVYMARNEGVVPATVRLHFERLRNLESSDPDTVHRIVHVGQSEVLTRLWVVDPEGEVRVRPIVTVDLGNDSAVHAPSEPYALPFGGTEPRQLISGYGGPTHLNENHYSFDFGMPEGTPILAARDGVVAYVQDGFTRGGLTPDLIERANLVVVGHDDGTLASYGHLMEGIPVTVGQRVERGELLGWSGFTGFTGRPHLHFHVGKRMMGGENRTIPVEFEVEASEGGWYGPAVERKAP